MKNLHLQNLKKDVQSKFIYHSGNSKTTRLQDSSQGSIFYSKTELLTHKTGAFITSKHEILRATSTSVKSLHKFHHTFAVFFFYIYIYIYIQSILVISKSKGPSKTLRDIHASTYQICSIEEKQFEQRNFTN